MSIFPTYRRGAPVFGLGGLLAALFMAGCGPKPAPSALAATNSITRTNVVAVTSTNLPDESTNSVFEDLLPPKGRDPFYPNSRRRVPSAVVTTEAVRADPVLVLKSIIRSHKHGEAVINDQILEEGEKPESVSVPNGHVMVRCIKVFNDYVEIQVDGGETQKLSLDEKKK